MTDNSNDPFWKMKLALLKAQLAHPDASVARFKAFFTEEFGQPPPPEFVSVFEKHLKKKEEDAPPREEKPVPAPSPKAGPSSLREAIQARPAPAAPVKAVQPAPPRPPQQTSRPPQPPPRPAMSAATPVSDPVKPAGAGRPARPTAADDETAEGAKSLLPAKLAILKKVLAHPNPSLQVLEQAFEEDLGFRLSPDVKAVFLREMRKRKDERDDRDN